MPLQGIEHERIHLETSSVLIRQMKIQDVQTQPAWAPCSSRGQAPQNELVDILPGVVRAVLMGGGAASTCAAWLIYSELRHFRRSTDLHITPRVPYAKRSNLNMSTGTFGQVVRRQCVWMGQRVWHTHGGGGAVQSVKVPRVERRVFRICQGECIQQARILVRRRVWSFSPCWMLHYWRIPTRYFCNVRVA